MYARPTAIYKTLLENFSKVTGGACVFGLKVADRHDEIAPHARFKTQRRGRPERQDLMNHASEPCALRALLLQRRAYFAARCGAAGDLGSSIDSSHTTKVYCSHGRPSGHRHT